MTTRILLSLITTVTLLATCLEGRYHLDATGLRHHRHEKHRRAWDHEQIPRGSRRDWEDEEDDEETSMDHRYKDRSSSSVAQGRRLSFGHDRRSPNGAPRRGRYGYERRGRGRNVRRDYYHPGGTSPWRHSLLDGAKARWEANRRASSGSDRSDGSWNRRNPSRYQRRRDDEEMGFEKPDERRRGRYEDEDEAQDEAYYLPKKTGNNYEPRSKGRKNHHQTNTWRDDWRPKTDDAEEEKDEDMYDYDPDYEDYDVEETEPRPYRKRHNKRVDNFEDFGSGKKKDVPGRRGSKNRDRLFSEEKKTRPEDLNEVDENDEAEDDPWDDEDDDEYEDTGTEDFQFSEEKEGSNLKAIDDVIRKLTAGDVTSTSKPPIRRDYRNIDNDRNSHRDHFGNVNNEAKNSPRVQTHGMNQGRPQSNWGLTTTSTSTTTTTRKPPFYAKYRDGFKAGINSSRNDVGTVINKKAERVNSTSIDVKRPLVSQITGTDPEAKTKSLEQDYEEYENDGGDDRPEDMDDVDGENENDKKLPSEKDRDYDEDGNPEDNENETERTLSTTTAIPSSTTSTTTTAVPSPISTRAFDHRKSRILDLRPRPNGFRNVQTVSTEYPPMSNYSAQKWNTLGSRKAVNEHRNSGRELDSSEARKAADHVLKMRKEALCRWPRPRVVSVRDVYPSPSKNYNPACTILHRCADDTGCCRSEGTCVPKHLHTVELSFYTSVIGSPARVEKLKFDNHTECECRPRVQPEPPTPPPPPPKPCKCPSKFVPKITPERGCHCDCHANQLPCLRQKRGKDYFPNDDRWCIQFEQCMTPTCEFGAYMRRQGRCPNISERFGSVNKFYSNTNVRYRN